MKIIDVTTAVVEANFDYTFVRIDTDAGLSGFGEGFFAPGLPSVAREVGSLLLGADPRDVRTLTRRMQMAISASSGPGSAGVGLHAISALETALWDLIGKVAGEPIWRMLGGAYRESVPVYADLHAGDGLASIDGLLRARIPFWASPLGITETADFYWTSQDTDGETLEKIGERVQAAATAGFRCVKLDIDVFEDERVASDATLPSGAVRQIAEKAAWLRENTPDHMEIAYDCHWRFDLPTARALSGALEPATPLWLEDPVPATSDALAAVSEVGAVAIASGENAYGLSGIESLAMGGGLHVATPDIQKVGGIWEGSLIGEWCARQGIGFAPHCIASPLGFIAAVHVMAVTPSVMYLEFHGADLPFWSELVIEDVIVEGSAPVPNKPGLGVTLDLEAVRRYSRPGEPVFDEDPSN